MKYFQAKLTMSRGVKSYFSALAIVNGNYDNLIAHVEQLHLNEEVIFNKFNYKPRKKSYLLGRYSAKKAVACLGKVNSLNQIWIHSGVFNYPVVKSNLVKNIQVSISHCDDIGMGLAFNEEHPMGIDIEKVDLNKTKTVLSQITVQERELLKRVALDDGFGYTLLWSAKEALSKVLKTGLMIDFSFLEISTINLNEAIITCQFLNFPQYKAKSYLINNYAISVVLPRKTTINFDANFFEGIEALFNNLKIIDTIV